MTVSVDPCADCKTRPVARGMCTRHYQRWKKTTPLADRTPPPRETLTDRERFDQHVNKAGPIAKNRPDLGRCHLWTRGKTRGGGTGGGEYGVFWLNGTTRRAHIVVYEWEVGPVPDGLTLDHFACDRTECVNWEHVQPATHRVNILRSTGPAAINAAKTVCDHGHDYDEANTYFDRHGKRQCKECRRINDREAKRVLRAAAKAAGLTLPEYLAQRRAARAVAAASE